MYLDARGKEYECEEGQVKTTLMVILLIGGAFAISLCGMAREVVLNEVAWAGNASDPTAEWIELYNTTDHIIDLSGWRLVSSDGAPNITLAGTIASQGYLVLYRLAAKGGDIAGRIYYAGALRDGGESLRLINSAGSEVDSANRQGGPWPAGKAGDVPYTMERIDSQGPILRHARREELRLIHTPASHLLLQPRSSTSR